MARRFALPALTALALTASLASLTLPAAGEEPKPGTIITVAGTGAPGTSGDNGPATQARLNGPCGMALDAAGNLYIAVWNSHRVRKVTPSGIITTVAGNGVRGFSGDGGKATDAQLNYPMAVALDGAGDLFISDFWSYRVRKVSPDGIITTYAGSGPVDHPGSSNPSNRGAFSGDNGPATDARLSHPTGLAVDALGNLFIADAYNNRIRKVSPDGVITTVAGNGLDQSSGDGGPATAAAFAVPFGLAVDAAGDLFIAETGGPVWYTTGGYPGHRVRKVGRDGIITTVAGTGKPGFSGDGGKATDAQLNSSVALVVDSVGNLFIADEMNYRVRKVSPEGIITTVAGNGTPIYAGDGRLATETGLRGPSTSGLAIDAAGNLFISNRQPGLESSGPPDDHRVVKVFGVAAPGLLAGKTFPQ